MLSKIKLLVISLLLVSFCLPQGYSSELVILPEQLNELKSLAAKLEQASLGLSIELLLLRKHLGEAQTLTEQQLVTLKRQKGQVSTLQQGLLASSKSVKELDKSLVKLKRRTKTGMYLLIGIGSVALLSIVANVALLLLLQK